MWDPVQNLSVLFYKMLLDLLWKLAGESSRSKSIQKSRRLRSPPNDWIRKWLDLIKFHRIFTQFTHSKSQNYHSTFFNSSFSSIFCDFSPCSSPYFINTSLYLKNCDFPGKFHYQTATAKRQKFRATYPYMYICLVNSIQTSRFTCLLAGEKWRQSRWSWGPKAWTLRRCKASCLRVVKSSFLRRDFIKIKRGGWNLGKKG